MKIPGWVVVIFMCVNGMGLAALNYDVLCPPKSAAFALVSIILAGLSVFLGLSKSPIQVSVTETTTTTTTSDAPLAAAAIKASVAAAARDKQAGKVEVAGLAGLVAIGMASFVAYIAVVTLTGLLLGGCAHSGQAFAELEGGAMVLAHDCGPGALADYSDVQSAIHNGGANWMTVVMDAIGCIEPVVMDELRMHHVVAGREVLLASAGYAPLPSTVSKAELRRARIAIAFERMALATKVKAPVTR